MGRKRALQHHPAGDPQQQLSSPRLCKEKSTQTTPSRQEAQNFNKSTFDRDPSRLLRALPLEVSFRTKLSATSCPGKASYPPATAGGECSSSSFSTAPAPTASSTTTTPRNSSEFRESSLGPDHIFLKRSGHGPSTTTAPSFSGILAPSNIKKSSEVPAPAPQRLHSDLGGQIPPTSASGLEDPSKPLYAIIIDSNGDLNISQVPESSVPAIITYCRLSDSQLELAYRIASLNLSLIKKKLLLERESPARAHLLPTVVNILHYPPRSHFQTRPEDSKLENALRFLFSTAKKSSAHLDPSSPSFFPTSNIKVDNNQVNNDILTNCLGSDIRSLIDSEWPTAEDITLQNITPTIPPPPRSPSPNTILNTAISPALVLPPTPSGQLPFQILEDEIWPPLPQS